jgi:putative nucleotidyltransferase with HDIG domain
MPITAAPNELQDQSTRLRITARQSLEAAVVAVGDRHPSHGPAATRISRAFDAVNTFPALAEPRNRLLSATADGKIATADAVSAIESDIALCVAVLRVANARERGCGRVESAVSAVELLRPGTIRALASRVQTFDFFECARVWHTAPERFRLHALATQRVANRIAAEVNYRHRDRLAITSLLHDIGKLVLTHAYPDYLAQAQGDSSTPSERAGRERTELGLDHGVIGGILIRRWGLPASLATAIEEHHNPEADGEAALLRLADMLAHHEQGAPVSARELLQSASTIGLDAGAVRRLMYELPDASSQRQLQTEACPLTGQELRVLQELAKGRVYKAIARELGLSPSTVRSHLHNTYGKLSVGSGAQAVLLAAGRGWL